MGNILLPRSNWIIDANIHRICLLVCLFPPIIRPLPLSPTNYFMLILVYGTFMFFRISLIARADSLEPCY